LLLAVAYSLTEINKKFEQKLSKSQIFLYCKIKSKENRFWRKKVKKKIYSITTQKSKVFGIFDGKKVKNIDFPNPGAGQQEASISF